MVTHLIGHFSKGGPRMLCGLPLRTGEIARNGDPACPECKRIDEQDAASLLALQQEPYIGPPLNTTITPIVPEGYRPKGTR